jgi:hypothetical protein
MRPLTRAQLLALPAATDLRTLGQAFGISEPVVRELRRQGRFEEMGMRINRLGLQYRVVTADILRVLGIDLPNETEHAGDPGHA